MGELVKIYGQVKLKDREYDIELNDPIDKKTGGIVHIQNKAFRLELSQIDFYKLVAGMNLAKKQLEYIKGDLYE